MTWIRTCWKVIGSLVFVLAAGPVQGREGPDRTLSPYFVIESGEGPGGSFPLESTGVEVSIHGVIADVLVTQTYTNEGERPINARYVFPGSTRASVHGMTITVDDQVVVARIRGRREARREFETARAQGKSASLLEQQRPNVFTMSVSNILPEDRVEVRLHYTELLTPEEGAYQFVYPTVVGPRYSGRGAAGAPEADRWVESPYLRIGRPPGTRFDIRVKLAAGLPLQEVSCPSHPVDVSWDRGGSAEVALRDPSDFGGDRDFVLDYRLEGGEIQSGLLLHRGERESFFLLMVQPPDVIRAADVPPREYVFVLDVSGSMQGFPLETAKTLMRGLIGRLRETDLFNVVLFAGGSRVLAPSSVPALEENARAAIHMIEREDGGGGTELITALETALALPRDDAYSRAVVVITDGFIDAERRAFEVIRRSLGRTNVFCFGIGSSVNRHLVEGIARAGGGEPFVVTRPEEAAAAGRFGRYVESPVLTNLQIAYDGFDAYDVEPAVLPDLFAERPIVLLGKWRGEAAGAITISGEKGGEPYRRTLRVSETGPPEQYGALRYLWARTRLERLSDFAWGRETEEEAAEVVSLGLTYSLLTKYTSFVAVVERVRNPGGDAATLDQPLPATLGVSAAAVGAGYAVGPEPEFWVLLAIAAALASPAVLRRRRRYATRQ